MRKLSALIIVSLVISLISCKSAYEKQGDKHLDAGRPLKALQRYKYVVKKGNGSGGFDGQLAKAYIGAFEKMAGGATIDGLDSYRTKITELLSGDVPSETNNMYGKIAYKVGANLITSGDYDMEGYGFKFLSDASKFGTAEDKAAVDKVKTDFIQQNLSLAEDEYASAKNGDAAQGIVADYILAKMFMFV